MLSFRCDILKVAVEYLCCRESYATVLQSGCIGTYLCEFLLFLHERFLPGFLYDLYFFFVCRSIEETITSLRLLLFPGRFDLFRCCLFPRLYVERIADFFQWIVLPIRPRTTGSVLSVKEAYEDDSMTY
jgi:hypothetical protein